MRWKGRRESENVEDRRGDGSGGGFPFPFPSGRSSGGFPFPLPSGGGGSRRGGGMGFLGIIIVIGIMLFFPNFGKLILGGGLPLPGGSGGGFPHIELPRIPSGAQRDSSQSSPGRSGSQTGKAGQGVGNDDMKAFLSVVLADTEDVWTSVFQQMHRTYKDPKMVMFSGSTRTACGVGMRQMGPFYCPLDQTVYIDTAFFNELKRKFGASGDFAEAYVVAHEVGHHVQNELGIIDKVDRYKSRYGQDSSQANAAQVRVELQADCFAGVWANRADRTKHILEQGDIEEALNAANSIGDDTIQRRTTGYVVPDSFTHGTSRQRVRWFKRGFQGGDLADCDTFSASSL